MRNRLYLILAAALLADGMSAAPVSRSEALKSAQLFINTSLQKAPARAEAAHTSIPESSSDTAYQPYYIFNIGNDEGFVIISGDDRAKTVLAYSDSGHFDPADMPDACGYWLGTYADQIRNIDSFAPKGDEDTTYTDYSDSEAVAPLLLTKWDQRYPYNLLCPETANGMRCLTGCVATAMAQVMKYHSYPERATGKVTYFDKSQNTERTFDFDAAPAFEWDNMAPVYNYNQTEAQCMAVARLMEAAGYAAKMQYSPEVSTAFQAEAGAAMINHFGYDRNMRYFERAMMPDEEWTRILLTELHAARPMIYCGRNSQGAHAFVCDGYDGEGMFHFNWGWGGKSDGYYSLSALNPGDQGAGGTDSGYTAGQNAICNIAPAGLADTGITDNYQLAIDNLYFRDATQFYKAQDVDEVTCQIADSRLFFYCFNNSFIDFNGEIAAATATDGTVTPLVIVRPEIIEPGAYKPATFPLSEAPLADGTYTVGFFQRRTAADKWQPVISHSDSPSFCNLKVAGSEVTMSPCYDFSGVNDIMTDKASVSIEPGAIKISMTSAIKEASLFDIGGTRVASANPGSETAEIPTASLKRGIYILHILTAGGSETVKLGLK